MATSLPWHPFLSPSKSRFLSSQRRAISTRHKATIQAFRRSDFDGFAKRVASGEAWKGAWRTANDGFELLLFDAKKTAERFDRQYSVSTRLNSVAQSAIDKARELDRELEIERRWRTFTLDFSRNFPRYRRQLNDFLGTPLGRSFSDSTLANELQDQENVLRQCIEQLESVEATRSALVAQLKEAIQDQESKLELIRTQLQVANARIDQESNMRQRLASATVSGPSPSTVTTLPAETMNVVEPNTLPAQSTSNTPQPPLTRPVSSFVASKPTVEEDHKKAAAAAVVAKLAASTSSAQMLTSVLSSLVAEEAASMNGGSKSGGFGNNFPFSMDKRPKLEKPMSILEMGSTTYFANVQQQPLNNSPHTPGQASTTSMQPLSQANQVQAPFPPPPPPLPPPPPPTQQYVQSTGMMASVMPYGYGATSLPPPPPPLPTHIAMGLARPGTQPQQPPQQHPATGSYYQLPGIGFYGQNHQPTTPPVPRQ